MHVDAAAGETRSAAHHGAQTAVRRTPHGARPGVGLTGRQAGLVVLEAYTVAPGRDNRWDSFDMDPPVSRPCIWQLLELVKLWQAAKTINQETRKSLTLLIQRRGCGRQIRRKLCRVCLTCDFRCDSRAGENNTGGTIVRAYKHTARKSRDQGRPRPQKPLVRLGGRGVYKTDVKIWHVDI